jgi:hypothetical protein
MLKLKFIELVGNVRINQTSPGAEFYSSGSCSEQRVESVQYCFIFLMSCSSM